LLSERREIMPTEKELIDAAILATEDVLTALNYSLDKLMSPEWEKGDVEHLLALAHEVGKGVAIGHDKLQFVLRALRSLQQHYQVELLERGGEGR
jgi:mevalonate kinase